VALVGIFPTGRRLVEASSNARAWPPARFFGSSRKNRYEQHVDSTSYTEAELSF
jgi:hypothetical protein